MMLVYSVTYGNVLEGDQKILLHFLLGTLLDKLVLVVYIYISVLL